MRSEEGPDRNGAAPRLSLCSRHLWSERSLLVVTGDLGTLLAGKRAYDARYGIPVDAAADVRALDRLLAAAALAAVSLAERESWGWTMTSAGAGHGLFCAAEPEGMICGTSRAADPDHAVAYVQRRKGDGPLVESRFLPVSGDPAASVQRYFEKVEQIDTRIAVDEEGAGALVQAMPGGALAELATMGDAELLAELRTVAGSDRAEHLDDVVVFYECRCDDALMIEMIAALPEASRKEIRADRSDLSIACPRCGRDFTISPGAVKFPETSGANDR
jgi:hypothetical protein